MINNRYIENNQIEKIIFKYPFLEDYLEDNFIEIDNKNQTFFQFIDGLDEEFIEDKAIDKDGFIEGIIAYLNQMIELLDLENKTVESITLLAGIDKTGNEEKYKELKINKGEIISIVGPTGSGKSRLLADIEWAAQRDTPTKRMILINDEKVDKKERFSTGSKLVAQLSQNMNFVMDLSAYEFVELHAQSRMIENREEIIEKIINKANELAGEKFTPDTPITSLSGGQSRALMIADTAILTSSPIVLIDEIENAGIDRKKALELLVDEDKIVLMATHDPILALMGDKRIIINNGAIVDIIDTTEEERSVLGKLEELDNIIQGMRNKLRYGKKIEL